MERVKYLLWDALPFAAMVIVECSTVGVNTLFKAAVRTGMSPYVFVVYSCALATLLLLPLSLLFHKTSALPPLTASILCRILLLSLIGTSSYLLGYSGIDQSSPTLASTITNLVPGFTFLLAVIFRMEKIELKRSGSKAKVVGTVVSILGAFVATLYKGPPVLRTSSSSASYSLRRNLLLLRESNMVGGLLFAAQSFMVSVWYILQASIVKEFPAELILVLIFFFFATIGTAIFSLIAEQNPGAWRLRPDMALFAPVITLQAVFGCVLRTSVHTWALHQKGPLFVAVFKPLSIVIAVVMGIIFLGDTFRLGSLIGGIVISIGFYAVMWGKGKEEKMDEEHRGVSAMESSNEEEPILQLKHSKIEEEAY